MIRITKSRHERFRDNTGKGGAKLPKQNLVVCGFGEWKNSKTVLDSCPKEHTALFLIAGEGWLDAPLPRRKMATGTFCLVPKGCAYQYTLEPQSRFLWFKLPKGEAWSQLIPSTTVVAPAMFLHELELLGEELLQESDLPEDPKFSVGCSRLIALTLRREFLRLEIPEESERLQRLENLWQKVSEKPSEDWSIESLAAGSHYSRSHFHAIVQRIYANSAMEIVASLRMRHAMGLIHDRKSKIASVAESVGYESPYSFSRAFKRIVGMTPESYRRRILNR